MSDGVATEIRSNETVPLDSAGLERVKPAWCVHRATVREARIHDAAAFHIPVSISNYPAQAQHYRRGAHRLIHSAGFEQQERGHSQRERRTSSRHEWKQTQGKKQVGTASRGILPAGQATRLRHTPQTARDKAP